MAKALLYTLVCAGMVVYLIFLGLTEQRGKIWPWVLAVPMVVLTIAAGGVLLGRISG